MRHSEEECNAKWRELIVRFNELTENSPAPASIQKELLEISKEAETTLLNYRQTQAIQERVRNYMAARYGKTKEGVSYRAA